MRLYLNCRVERKQAVLDEEYNASGLFCVAFFSRGDCKSAVPQHVESRDRLTKCLRWEVKDKQQFNTRDKRVVVKD